MSIYLSGGPSDRKSESYDGELHAEELLAGEVGRVVPLWR